MSKRYYLGCPCLSAGNGVWKMAYKQKGQPFQTLNPITMAYYANNFAALLGMRAIAGWLVGQVIMTWFLKTVQGLRIAGADA